MKFELLPNEILIECFKYLDALDIFYSFDQLNYRFNQLIRHISLYVNFQHVRKSMLPLISKLCCFHQTFFKMNIIFRLVTHAASFIIDCVHSSNIRLLLSVLYFLFLSNIISMFYLIS
jgi:hypothetical protein